MLFCLIELSKGHKKKYKDNNFIYLDINNTRTAKPTLLVFKKPKSISQCYYKE